MTEQKQEISYTSQELEEAIYVQKALNDLEKNNQHELKKFMSEKFKRHLDILKTWRETLPISQKDNDFYSDKLVLHDLVKGKLMAEKYIPQFIELIEKFPPKKLAILLYFSTRQDAAFWINDLKDVSEVVKKLDKIPPHLIYKFLISKGHLK